MANIVQCDRCKALVVTGNIGHMSFRDPRSMRDAFGTTIEIDLCVDCLDELNPLSVTTDKPVLELKEENNND